MRPKCERFNRIKVRNNKAHDITCLKSCQYNKPTSISQETRRVNKVASTNLLINNRKLKGDEKGGTEVLTAEEVADFCKAIKTCAFINSNVDDNDSDSSKDDDNDNDNDDDNDKITAKKYEYEYQLK